MNYVHRIVGGRAHETNKTNEGETKYSMATMTVNSRFDVICQIYSGMNGNNFRNLLIVLEI